MCGLAGVWERGGGVASADVVRGMGEAIRHRGPDAFGIFADGSFGVSHARLAIIDLSAAGQQPMTTDDGRYVLAFNGEIYNYRELARAYLPDVKLRSTSDTEVLLHLLSRGGEAVLPKLRGMFALAFWDKQEQVLILARDPFGKKPLYWAHVGEAIVFGSEVKALLQYPRLKAEPDQVALTQYFLHEYVPAPATGFRGIAQVNMGSVVTITRREVQERVWWEPKYLPKTQDPFAEVEPQFDRLLSESVRRRLIADVPVGLLLSGGLDSTTIGWYMKHVGFKKLSAFSIAFDEPSFDESHYARLSARALGVDHHLEMFNVDTFHEVIDEVVAGVDVPLADASLLPTYVLSRLARKHVTVVLDGDGSDELFGGYGTFTAARLADLLPRLPERVVEGLLRLAQILPTDLRNFSFDFKLKSFIEGLSYSRLRRNQVWLGSFTPKDLVQLLQPGWRTSVAQLFARVDEMEGVARGLGGFDTISLLKVQHYLQNDLLVKLDRATMLHALEARTPFLDVDLAEFVMRLPARYKRNKRLLKTVMRGRIPDEIIDRPKRGFGVPIGFWLKGPLYSWAEKVLAPPALAATGVLEAAYVQRLLREHKAGKFDHRKKLWTLLMFQLWYQRWMSH